MEAPEPGSSSVLSLVERGGDDLTQRSGEQAASGISFGSFRCFRNFFLHDTCFAWGFESTAIHG
jgi:hypothetical protein